MVVIGYYHSQGVIYDSRGHATPVFGLADILESFLESFDQPGQTTWKLAWDIDDLVIPVLRLMDKELLQTLGETERCEFYAQPRNGPVRRYRLWYPRNQGVGQAFGITNKSEQRETMIWHLGSFMPDGMPPPDDAIDVELYGRKILSIFAKRLGYQPLPGSFFSPVNVVKPYLQRMSLPKLADLPPKVANYASKCMSPPWVEAHQLGYFDNAFDYDLSNAYSTILRDLPDWRLGTWAEGADYQAKAMMGYCCCNINIDPKVTLHPIITEQDDGLVVCGTGPHKETYRTKAQIDFIRSRKLGTVEILDGVWWFPSTLHPIRQPLKTVISRLTRQRNDMEWDEKPVDRMLGRYEAKKAMVGMWGYTARWDWENDKEPDEFYNPPWAAEITTRIPLKVAAFIYRKHLVDNVINIAVDGFPSDREAELTPEDIAQGWKLSETGPTLVMSRNHAWLGTKRPEGLQLGQVMQLIGLGHKARNSLWVHKFNRQATLGDCMQRGDLGLLGETIECQSTLHVKQDHNRVFAKGPKTGRDLLTHRYRSKPFEIKEESHG